MCWSSSRTSLGGAELLTPSCEMSVEPSWAGGSRSPFSRQRGVSSSAHRGEGESKEAALAGEGRRRKEKVAEGRRRKGKEGEGRRRQEKAGEGRRRQEKAGKGMTREVATSGHFPTQNPQKAVRSRRKGWPLPPWGWIPAGFQGSR